MGTSRGFLMKPYYPNSPHYNAEIAKYALEYETWPYIRNKQTLPAKLALAGEYLNIGSIALKSKMTIRDFEIWDQISGFQEQTRELESPEFGAFIESKGLSAKTWAWTQEGRDLIEGYTIQDYLDFLHNNFTDKWKQLTKIKEFENIQGQLRRFKEKGIKPLMGQETADLIMNASPIKDPSEAVSRFIKLRPDLGGWFPDAYMQAKRNEFETIARDYGRRPGTGRGTIRAKAKIDYDNSRRLKKSVSTGRFKAPIRSSTGGEGGAGAKTAANLLTLPKPPPPFAGTSSLLSNALTGFPVNTLEPLLRIKTLLGE